MIQTVDNYQTFSNDTEKYYFRFSGNKSQINKDKRVINENLEITLKDYQDEKYPNNIFFSFFNDHEKIAYKNQDDLIISINKSKNENDEDLYQAQTGNYVGKFTWQGLEIDIKSRFSNTFLERMLNFANNIFLDDVSITGKESKKDIDISKYIIYYMFIQNLEKAFLLGLPKSYTSIKHHEMKLKGKIDINRFIKHDIPFTGKISSISREQKEIQEIIDILYKAVKIIDNNKFPTKNISHIKTHLKQHRSNKFVSNQTINSALKSKALQNPIFAPFKKVLEYARFIINDSNIDDKNPKNQNTFGFIINVAELFEIYITKLLQKELSDWNIESPKIELYSNQCFARKIIPDIVMTKDKEVIVFDTKYKKMTMRGRDRFGAGDVDREDFFQINTYMSYYQNSGYSVKIGGLLYPMEEFDEKLCHSETWFGNSNTRFIVDGINLKGLDDEEEDKDNKFKDMKHREEEFIHKINVVINLKYKEL